MLGRAFFVYLNLILSSIFVSSVNPFAFAQVGALKDEVQFSPQTILFSTHSLSPDENFLAFEVVGKHKPSSKLLDKVVEDIWVLDLSHQHVLSEKLSALTGAFTHIGAGTVGVSWDSRSSRIIYSESEYLENKGAVLPVKTVLKSLDLRNRRVSQLVDDGSLPKKLTYSPSEDIIAFLAVRDDKRVDLVMYSVAERKAKTFERNVDFCPPVWLSQGKEIAFVKNGQIWKEGVRGNNASILMREAVDHDHSIVELLPQEQAERFYFFLRKVGEPSGTVIPNISTPYPVELWELSLKTGKKSFKREFSQVFLNVALDKEKLYLALPSEKETRLFQTHLYMYDLNTGSLTPLTEGEGSEDFPVVIEKRGKLLYRKNGKEIWELDMAGAKKISKKIWSLPSIE